MLVSLVVTPMTMAADPKVQSVAQIDTSDAKKVSIGKKKSRAEFQADRSIDSAMEAEALALVENHLPNLNPILSNLRTSHPKSYDKAIRGLSRSANRLATAQKRDPKLYVMELRLLQSRNEVDLLTAKLKVRDDQDDRNSLRKAISEMLKAQIERANYDVVLYERRLDNITKQLQAARMRVNEKQDGFDAQLESAINRAIKKAGRDERK